MENKLSFEILGIPKPKQSARFRIVDKKTGGRFIASYQKKSVMDNEANISWTVTQQLPQGFVPFDCPIHVDIKYIFPIPTSMSKKDDRAIREGKKIFKPTKPDLSDNLNKGLIDALSGIIFVNDSRIVSMTAEKYYGITPRTIIEFRPLG